MAEFLSHNRIKTYVCVATEYGGTLMEESSHLSISTKRMDMSEMTELIEELSPEIVIDATHPYALEVGKNIRKACDETNTKHIRLLRASEDTAEEESGCIYVDSVEEAVEYLKEKQGNIFVTTGSKELHKYTEIPDYKNRVTARVLSTLESVEICRNVGFEGKNLICMQGPFSKEINKAMLNMCDARYMVTKLSGKAGGYEEKLQAAIECGCKLLLVGRPVKENGLTLPDCKKEICEKFNINVRKDIKLVGIGAGSLKSMTEEAIEAIENAELVIGAGRMLEAVREKTGDKEIFKEYDSERIAQYINERKHISRVAVLLSGDTGFFSGAKKLRERLSELGYEPEQICGVSSLSYFMSRIAMSWDDAIIVSNHGIRTSLIPLIRDNNKVVSIMGKRDDIRKLAGKLIYYDMNDVRIYVGENLSYENEKITSGNPEEFISYENDSLCIVCVINDDVKTTRINPLSFRKDDEFIRGKVPMTKEQIRAVSVSLMKLEEDSVCYDIGAGTGGVTMEMAIRVPRGKVYAVEKTPEAVRLINDNKRKFKADNIEITEGMAPDVMDNLPDPDVVFIGGSSGNIEKIVKEALNKNSAARFVINCIAIESIGEAVSVAKKYSSMTPRVIQISVAEGHRAGPYTLMKGENPIAIIFFEGEKQ